jgi:DNA-binding transcriptional MerR regulator
VSEPTLQSFRSTEACRLTGCTPSQLRYWDNVGLARPSIASSEGKAGVRRLYAFPDLVRMRAIKSLLDAGLTLQKIRRAFDEIERLGLARDGRIATDGKGVFVVDSQNETITDALRRGQLAFFEGVMAATEQAAVVDGAFTRDAEVVRRAIRSAERDLTRTRRAAR